MPPCIIVETIGLVIVMFGYPYFHCRDHVRNNGRVCFVAFDVYSKWLLTHAHIPCSVLVDGVVLSCEAVSVLQSNVLVTTRRPQTNRSASCWLVTLHTSDQLLLLLKSYWLVAVVGMDLKRATSHANVHSFWVFVGLAGLLMVGFSNFSLSSMRFYSLVGHLNIDAVT